MLKEFKSLGELNLVSQTEFPNAFFCELILKIQLFFNIFREDLFLCNAVNSKKNR